MFVGQGTISTEQFSGLDSAEKTPQQCAPSGKLGQGQGVDRDAGAKGKRGFSLPPGTASGATITKMHVQNAQNSTIMP